VPVYLLIIIRGKNMKDMIKIKYINSRKNGEISGEKSDREYNRKIEKENSGIIDKVYNREMVRCNNCGSMVIEMSLIMPLIVCIVFLLINILLFTINSGMAQGDMYVMLYTKEEYVLADENADICDTAAQTLQETLEEGTYMTSNIKADMKSTDKSIVKELISAQANTQEFEINLSYSENLIGTGLVLNTSSRQLQMQAKQEVRDTGKNLRRWQIYGGLLSD
jgi:hypothetical protein